MNREQNGATHVSVIIPTFNDEPGVHRCLSAIAEQTYRIGAVEVIVVDNGSTPPLLLRERYPFAARLVRCATPGSYAARNAGVEAAAGTIFAFVDADCWPDPEWLSQGVQSVLAEPEAAIIAGEVVLVLPNNPSAVALYQYAVGFGQEQNVRDKSFSATANLFCTRAQFEATGPFDERLLSGGDREWCWRAAKRGVDIKYEPKAMVYTRPRASLWGAIRQARRVTHGRMMLRRLGLAHIGEAAVRKQRSSLQAIQWILSNRDFSVWDRLRILCIAVFIRVTAAAEYCRLALGASGERR